MNHILRSGEIHARVHWPTILRQLGIAEEFLRLKKAGPCLLCGGTDRYTFDNRKGRGDYICRGCGAGDGFTLLQRAYGWDFRTARDHVIEAAGLAMRTTDTGITINPVTATMSAVDVARPTTRVRQLMRSTCALADCPEVMAYLESRRLWPLPAGCALKAHPLVEYFEEGQRIGRYPAILAAVRDLAGELVTVSVTYIKAGRKLAPYEPRKLLSPLTGNDGCAVRLTPMSGDTLGIAEGIETALSAALIHAMPVWAALNTALLAKFEPPATVERLVVFADCDEPGLEAARRLMARLQGRVSLTLRPPPAPHKDWNEYLMNHRSEP